jgi:hypothetical protein
VVVSVVGGLFVLGVIGAALGAGEPAADGPADERKFISIVQDGQDVGENEVAVHKASEKRADQMCAALPKDLTVTNWVGEVATVDTTSGGDSGVLDVRIADGINLTTWNNGVSDAGDGTLIDPDSALYDTLATLEEGDEVTFSGQFVSDDSDCVREQSLFETNSMEHPAFVFQFTAVSAN